MRNLHQLFVLCTASLIIVEVLQNFVAFSEYMNFMTKAAQSIQTGSNHARSWSKVNEESTIHERLIGFDFVLGRPFDRLAVT